jgi:hypothetical protein
VGSEELATDEVVVEKEIVRRSRMELLSSAGLAVGAAGVEGRSGVWCL